MLIVALLIFVTLVQLLISIGLFIESRRTKNIAQKIFVAVGTCFSIWTIILVLLSFVDSRYNTGNINYFNIINKLGYALGSLSLLMVYIFNLYYPQKKKIGIVSKLTMIAGTAVSLLSFNSAISGYFSISTNGSLEYTVGLLSAVFALFILYILLSVVISGTWTLRHSNDQLLRRQVRTMLTGVALTVIHAVVFIVVLAPLFNNNVTLYAIGYLAPYYYIGFTIHSLVNQKLFDIRLLVARTLGYIFTLATLVGFYVIAVFVLSTNILGVAKLTLTQEVLYILATLVFGFSLAPLKRFFDKYTNKLFFRDAYDSQVLLDELNKILVGNIDIQPLLRQCSELFESTLKAEHCTFIIKETDDTARRIIGSKRIDLDEEQILELSSQNHRVDQIIVADDLESSQNELKTMLSKNNVSILARLAPAGKNAVEQGYLVLGAKRSGNPYNKQDLQVLDIIANELVIAIQNALRFEEIEAFTVTLQEKVDDATRQLRRTNEKLKALDETKDEFISMASHQLRTPLTAVKGYVSMVVEGDAGKLNKQQKELLDQAFASSQRMVYLIADLLNVSRLKTGKFVIENKTTQLADVVEAELAQLKEVAAGKQQTLTYTKPDKFPEMMLDETKIRQVIMNFTDNALHYTPNGGHIEVKLEDKGQTIEFTVVDDGLGVPKAEQHHLFGKFFRAGNARKARPDGTGLGLFMAKKVIIAQGGAVIFSSTEGKGSTFGFTMPKNKSHTLTPEK